MISRHSFTYRQWLAIIAWAREHRVGMLFLGYRNDVNAYRGTRRSEIDFRNAMKFTNGWDGEVPQNIIMRDDDLALMLLRWR